MSTLKTNNIEHLDASTPSIQTTIGGGTILAGVSTVSGALNVGSGTSISSPATNTLALGTNSSERLRITSDGKIGIGTDDPQVTLQLGKPSDDNTAIRMHSSSTAYLQFSSIGTRSNIIAGRTSGNSELMFYTSSAGTNEQRMVITKDGNVGIGTDSPLQTSGGRTVLNINGTNNALLNFSYGSTLSGFLYGANDEFRMEADGTKPLVFRTAGGTALTIDTNAKLILPTGSPGIQFGTTDSGGSVTSQTLDDYEEGTWIPVYEGQSSAGSYTYTDQIGTYVKIGNLVTVNYRLTNITTVSAGSGSLNIGGLPFTSASGTGQSAGNLRLDLFNIVSDAVNLVLNINQNDTKLAIYVTRDNLSDIAVAVTNKTSDSADIVGQFSYFT